MTPQAFVAHYGSIAAAARALRVKPPSVSQWLSADAIPIGRQCQIELLTGGALRADRDVDGNPVTPASQEAA